MKVQWRIIGILAMVLLLGGCIRPMSEEALLGVDWELDYAQVKADPGAFTGKTLLLGGMIVDNAAGREGSVLEIVKYDLDRWDKPDEPDYEGGRFLVRTDKFLDPALYEKGRVVTLTGTLAGSEKKPLGKREYDYPVFGLEEIYLWDRYYRQDPYYYPYDPFYPYRYHYPYHRHWW